MTKITFFFGSKPSLGYILSYFEKKKLGHELKYAPLRPPKKGVFSGEKALNYKSKSYGQKKKKNYRIIVGWL